MVIFALPRRARAWWTNTYSPRERRWLTVIVLVAFAVRLGWVLFAARAPVVGDPVAYMFQGEVIARGGGYVSFVSAITFSRHLAPTAFYPIGYPATLGGLFWIVLHSGLPHNFPKAVGIFQALLGVATVLLMGELARRVFGNRVALLTAAVVALWPNLVFYAADAHVETVFVFLVAAALVVIVRPWPEGTVSWSRVVAFGVVLGLAVLVRPPVLMLLPVLLISWVVAGATWRRAVAQVALATLIVGVVVTPWLVRNTVVMHATVFSTGIGDALCNGRHPGATGRFESTKKYCTDPDRERGLSVTELEVARNRENTNKAIRFVFDHPLDEVSLWFRRGYYAYRDDHEALSPGRSDRGYPLYGSRVLDVLEAGADAYYGIAAVLALFSLPVFLRRRGPNRAQRLCLLLAGAQAAIVPFLLFGDPRYKLPALPFVAVGAAVTLSAIAERFTARASRRTARQRSAIAP
jgi:4-amino-4-deoxy-L-arabinose transferase-like glycosyltransferase